MLLQLYVDVHTSRRVLLLTVTAVCVTILAVSLVNLTSDSFGPQRTSRAVNIDLVCRGTANVGKDNGIVTTLDALCFFDKLGCRKALRSDCSPVRQSARATVP